MNPKEFFDKFIKDKYIIDSVEYMSLMKDMYELQPLSTYTEDTLLGKMSKITVTECKELKRFDHFLYNYNYPYTIVSNIKVIKDNRISFGEDIDNLKLLKVVASKYKKYGENLGFYSRDPKRVVISFLMDVGVSSKGHRKAILSKKYTNIGVYHNDKFVSINFGK